ncbi:dynein axonemal heavy chain 7-like [Linepithema humile]|uniref:dynein axonemal heavy chain 7-like n=1 Tax=Linepithema humile TaxID=83485 RepID=UPI00351E1890
MHYYIFFYLNKHGQKRKTASKKKDDKEISYQKNDYYTSLRRQRAEFRIHLIRKIKGREKRDESQREEAMEICPDDAKEPTVLDDDVCGQTTTASSSDIDDSWLTEEDKNLLRYYYYILHEVDDAYAGTLDSDTLKKITSMVPAEWQERQNECFGRLIKELRIDFVTSMKKSIVDFALQEPFEEAYSICAPVSAECMTIQH